ncbi:MAG: hypothetical protein RPU13_16760 [Candidatus Sedimenticola sp. (ex Thyasira tokunagai)]
MKGVAISCIKGGTGKTTISHALALGAAWHNTPGYLCHTDNRDPISTINRPYKYYDARDSKHLEFLMGKALTREGLFIIDGGGNREKLDYWIASCVDLVVIPITPDPEDVKEGIRYADLMYKAGAKKVVYLINKYPSNVFEREYVEKYIEQLPIESIIGKVNNVNSLKILRESDSEDFKTPNTKVNNFCRSVYRLINGCLLHE